MIQKTNRFQRYSHLLVVAQIVITLLFVVTKIRHDHVDYMVQPNLDEKRGSLVSDDSPSPSTTRFLMDHPEYLTLGIPLALLIGIQIVTLFRFRTLSSDLHQSETRYQRMIESLYEGIWAIDKENCTTFANSRMAAMLKTSTDEMIGRSLFAYMDDTGIAEAKKKVGRRMQGQSEQHEFVFLRNDGSRLHALVATSPQFDDDGNYTGAVAGVLDITALKQAETALKENEIQLATLFDQAAVGVALLETATGRFIRVNRKYAEILGLQPDEMTATTFMAITHPDDLQEDLENMERLKQGSIREFNMQKRHRRANGSLVWVDLTVSAAWEPGQPPLAHVAVIQDITDRKQMETMLHAHRFLLDETGRIARIGGWEHDLATGKATWTQALYDIIEVDGDEPPGVDEHLDYYPPVDRRRLEEAYRRCLQDGTPFDLELQGNTARGRRIWCRATAEPVYGDQRIVKLRGIFQDITDRKTAELAIQQLNAQLEQRVAERTAQLEAKNRELETFTYSVSHDLKAPLRGIDGYSRLLQEAYTEQLDDEGRFFINTIRHSTQQMSRLIDDLLAYSRLERRALACSPVDLSALVNQVVLDYQEEIRRAGVDLTVAVPKLSVIADRDGLAMVLRNFLDNAIKFTGSTSPPRIDISAHRHNDCCRLSVKDNGLGFEMRFHDRIFAIFQRLHRAEDYPGTGIGLALVKKAADRMGGRTWAESKPDHGASFFLELPLSEEPA